MKILAASVEDKGFLVFFWAQVLSYFSAHYKVKYVSEFFSQSKKTRSAIYIQKYNLSGSEAGL